MDSSYKIIFTQKAKENISKLKKSGNNSVAFKLISFIVDLSEHPREGLGQPERLKYFEDEVWSRRLNLKDRLVYLIDEKQKNVFILSVLGHYDDK